jgi:hypothetical protein
LKWSPPSVGTATFYDILLYWLSNVGGNTAVTASWQFRSARTTLPIPQGLMSAGMGYVFVIRAWYIPGLNFSQRPFMKGPVFALADVISGMMQP